VGEAQTRSVGSGEVQTRFQGDMANATVGMIPAQRHRRVAVCGEVARWRRRLAPGSNCSRPRVGNGKSGA
jgi:hypothetical protein